MRHKLTTFILRNPPDLPPDGAAKGKKKKGESTGGEEDGESPDENGTNVSIPAGCKAYNTIPITAVTLQQLVLLSHQYQT